MKKIKITEIHTNPENPRTIRDEKFKKLVKSLQEFPEMMSIRPVVVNNEMMILGGNMRYEAAKAAGWKEIPIEVVDLTPDQQREFIIKDNVSGGDWDFDALASGWDVEQLTDWGVDVPDTFETKKEVTEDEFDVNEDIDTDIVIGDMFQVGGHRLLCGDSTDSDQVARLMGGELADMIFTDPPYDLEDNYSGNIFEIVKESCHIFIMNSDKLLIQNVNNGFKWFRKFFAVDFRLARLVDNNQPMTRADFIAEFCKGKTRFKNLYDGFSTLIQCAKISNNNDSINFGHKQAKRVELPATFISHYSEKNEIIVDLFGGSGSTMAAAEQLERKCYMMEFEPKNCQIIINRMKKMYNLEETKLL
jgi:16S rRNA G966 N2-methylase RsmD